MSDNSDTFRASRVFVRLLLVTPVAAALATPATAATDPATVVAEAAIPLFTPFVLVLFLVVIAALGVLALARRT